MPNLKKILLLFISTIAFIFGDHALIQDSDELVEIHDSHKSVSLDDSKV